jgi:hypothetical protein
VSQSVAKYLTKNFPPHYEFLYSIALKKKKTPQAPIPRREEPTKQHYSPQHTPIIGPSSRSISVL